MNHTDNANLITTKSIPQIERFLKYRPKNAATLRVSENRKGEFKPLLDIPIEELSQPSQLLSEGIAQTCETFTESARKETHFVVQWLNNEGDQCQTTNSITWLTVTPILQSLPGFGNANDVSFNEILVTMHSHTLARERQQIELINAVHELITTHMNAYQKRVEFLETRFLDFLQLKEDLVDEAKSKTDDERWMWIKSLVEEFLKSKITSPGSHSHQ